jgi:predicted metalloendopeptidase
MTSTTEATGAALGKIFERDARGRRNNSSRETAQFLLQIDTHSPGKFRVNDSFSNLPEFAQAFDVPDGSPSDKRVQT